MLKSIFKYRFSGSTLGLVFSLSLLFGFSSSQALAQDKQPAIEMTSILGAGLDQSGGLMMTTLDVVFAPPGGAEAEIVLKNGDGDVIQSFDLRPEYRASKEVYARLMVNGALYAKLEDGDYLLDFMVDDELATRFPFTVVSEDDGDDFTSSNKKQFIGPWQELAYLHYSKARNFTASTDYNSVNLRMWGSKDDLSVGSSGEPLQAKLMRDGELIGYSKKPVGFLSTNKPVNRVDMVLFKPHSKQQEANVLGLSEADLLSGDHLYQLTVERQEDGEVIRDFTFQSKDGKLVPLPRTELGHSPHHEYLAPRAAVFGTQNYEFEPVYWLQTD